MAEKTASELLREQLAYKRKNGRLYSDESVCKRGGQLL